MKKILIILLAFLSPPFFYGDNGGDGFIEARKGLCSYGQAFLSGG